jgi:hypothetical protein
MWLGAWSFFVVPTADEVKLLVLVESDHAVPLRSKSAPAELRPVASEISNQVPCGSPHKNAPAKAEA